jgi:hypothetical protein
MRASSLILLSEIASIVADVTDGGPNAKAERPELIPYAETGQHTDRGDRNEFVELARCRHRAWRRASAVEEACSRRECLAERFNRWREEAA